MKRACEGNDAPNKHQKGAMSLEDEVWAGEERCIVTGESIDANCVGMTVRIIDGGSLLFWNVVLIQGDVNLFERCRSDIIKYILRRQPRTEILTLYVSL
ncbi:ORF64 [Plodia interpunctella granulovirus]|uniref:ORF64 n=1 Tax=Plodia interpunctella granulovirus TaxID=262175 RepID=A0A1L5JH60_9BBAC|nr:ORF64 [Plodia interpunctella granulovirus]APO13948.1 ORF64 [Plodia interpunctella granulovirus]